MRKKGIVDKRIKEKEIKDKLELIEEVLGNLEVDIVYLKKEIEELEEKNGVLSREERGDK